MKRRNVKRRNEERPSGPATPKRSEKSAKSADEKRGKTRHQKRLKRRGREGRFARDRAPKAGEFDDGKADDRVRIRTRPIERRVFKSLIEKDFEVFARRAGRRFEFEAAELVDEAHVARTVGVGAPTVVKARAHLERRRDRPPGQPIIAKRPRGERGGENERGRSGDAEETGENGGVGAVGVKREGRGVGAVCAGREASPSLTTFRFENEKSKRKDEKRCEREEIEPTRSQVNGCRRKNAERGSGKRESTERRRRVGGEKAERFCGFLRF